MKVVAAAIKPILTFAERDGRSVVDEVMVACLPVGADERDEGAWIVGKSRSIVRDSENNRFLVELYDS